MKKKIILRIYQFCTSKTAVVIDTLLLPVSCTISIIMRGVPDTFESLVWTLSHIPEEFIKAKTWF